MTLYLTLKSYNRTEKNLPCSNNNSVTTNNLTCYRNYLFFEKYNYKCVVRYMSTWRDNEHVVYKKIYKERRFKVKFRKRNKILSDL